MGNLVYATCQWGILIAIARLGSPEMVGQFAMGQALVVPIFRFANLNLRSVHVTDVGEKYRADDIVSLRLITSAVGLLAVGLIYGFAPSAMGLGLVIGAVALEKVTVSVSDILHSLSHKRERMKDIAIARSVRGIVSLMTLTCLLTMSESLPLALLGMGAVNVLLLAAVDVPMTQRIMSETAGGTELTLHANYRVLLPLMWLCLPMGAGAAIMGLNLNLPRYLIAHYLDVKSLGFYASAAYLLVISDLIVRSARQTALPRLARYFAEGKFAAFRKLTGTLMLLGAACVLPFVLFAGLGGATALECLYGPEYRAAASVFLWLMVANLLWQSSVPIAALWAMRVYRADLTLHIVTGSVILLSGMYLVPLYGLEGAAWAYCAGRMVSSLATATVYWLVLVRSQRFAACTIQFEVEGADRIRKESGIMNKLRVVSNELDREISTAGKVRKPIRKIVLCGASSICGLENFGDELLCDMTVRTLSRVAPDAELRLLKFAGFRAAGLSWSDEFAGADALVFIGGGYFGEPDHPGMQPLKRWAKSVAWSIRNDRLYGAAYRQARRQRIPHCAVGVEVGPIKRSFYRRSVRQLLESADQCAVRSPESFQFARDYGVRRDNLELCVDSVLALQRGDLPLVAKDSLEQFLASRPRAAGAGEFRLGVHLSSLGEEHRKKEHLLVELIDTVRRAVPERFVVSLCFLYDQIHQGQHPTKAREAETFFRQHFPQMEVIPYEEHWKLVGVLGGMSCVITTKLHVAITSRALDVPVLSIPRHQKTPRFFRHIGEPDSCLTIQELQRPEIPDSLRQYLAGWHPRAFRPVRPEARRTAEKTLALLEDFVINLRTGTGPALQRTSRVA